MAARRGVRVLSWVAGVLVVVLVLAALGAVWTVRRSFPQVAGAVQVPGLSSTVEVRRDAYGVPHVIADTSEDLFFAQGFVHAQDQFFEMDFRRHVTAGRLAEMFGPDQLQDDVFLRTLGWRRVAETELELLSPETTLALEAYAAGVNAYLAGRAETEVSLEYAVLALQNPGYEIEPWQPADSVAWLKAMAWESRSLWEIDRVQIAAAVGEQRAEQLFPDYPWGRHQPAVTSGAVGGDGVFDQAAAPGAGSAPATGAAVAQAVTAVQASMSAVDELLGPAGPGVGSNAWVLAGSRTESGAPILANDAHGGPSIPSQWYQLGLHCRVTSEQCPYRVAGVSFVGLPGVILGHNDDIAWGFTNLSADVADLYLEKVRGDAVVVDGQEQPLKTRTEQIEVAGGEPVTITVRSTRNGPLLSDADEFLLEVAEDAPAAGSESDLAVSLRWTALDPGRTADAIFALNAASGFEEFREAAKLFEVPAQNMLYADTEGNIGYQAPGRFPIRGQGDGRWPAPGWDSAYDWVGEVPFEALPSVLNPDEGYISSANQPLIDLRDYPYWLGTDWAYGSRGQRIVDVIEGTSQAWDAQSTSQMQLDSHSDIAEFLVPALLQVDGLGGTAAAAQQLLDGWDLQQPEDSPAAAYFNAVWRALLTALVGDELDDPWAAYGDSRWFEVVRTLWDSPTDPWWDDTTSPEVEDRDAALRLAMQQGADELSARLGDNPDTWQWGDLHTLELVHPSLGTSGISIVERLFNRGPIPSGGGTSSVNAIEWDARLGYEVVVAPFPRMVIDLSDFDASRWINVTGASGHAFHSHYWDQTGLWRQGETIPFPFSPEAVAEATSDLLSLHP